MYLRVSTSRPGFPLNDNIGVGNWRFHHAISNWKLFLVVPDNS